MVFVLFLGMLILTAGYLLKQDLNNNTRIRKLEKTLKTYIENGKKRQTEKAEKTGHNTDRHKPSDTATKTTGR